MVPDTTGHLPDVSETLYHLSPDSGQQRQHQLVLFPSLVPSQRRCGSAGWENWKPAHKANWKPGQWIRHWLFPLVPSQGKALLHHSENPKPWFFSICHGNSCLFSSRLPDFKFGMNFSLRSQFAPMTSIQPNHQVARAKVTLFMQSHFLFSSYPTW